MRVLLMSLQIKKIPFTFFDNYRQQAYRIQGLGASGIGKLMTPEC